MQAAEHLAHLRRRAPFYLLVIGLAVLVLLYARRQPSEVGVTYRLGIAAEGLRTLRARYVQGTEQAAAVRFSFAEQRAAAPRHEVRLPDGDYDVLVDLDYRAGAPAVIRKRTRRVSRSTWSGRWPLIVRGSGEVAIIIAADR